MERERQPGTQPGGERRKTAQHVPPQLPAGEEPLGNSAGGAEHSAPLHGEALKKRIAELREALAELRADNERNAKQVANRISLALSFPALLGMGRIFADNGQVAGSGPVASGLNFPVMYILIMSYVGWPLEYLSTFMDGLFNTAEMRPNAHERRRMKYHLYRIQNLDGSGVAEELLADRRGGGQLSDSLSTRTGLRTSQDAGNNAQKQLRSLFASCRSVPSRGVSGPLIQLGPSAFDIVVILLISIGMYNSNYGLRETLLFLPLFALWLYSGLLGKRNRWRLGMLYFEDYFERAFDFYEKQGSLELAPANREKAPSEIEGTRLIKRTESICAQLRMAVMEQRQQEESPVAMILLVGCVATILLSTGIAFSSYNAEQLWPVMLAIIFTGVVFMLRDYFRIDSLLRQMKRQYTERIVNRGLVEQLLDGNLPKQELRDASPVWLQNLLYLPFTTMDVDPNLGRDAWQLMWNLDWFLRREGSSLRRDQAAYLGMLLILAMPLLIAVLSIPFESVPILTWAAYAALSFFMSIFTARTILRHRAGALAMLEVLEERLVEGKGGEAPQASLFGIADPGRE